MIGCGWQVWEVQFSSGCRLGVDLCATIAQLEDFEVKSTSLVNFRPSRFVREQLRADRVKRSSRLSADDLRLAELRLQTQLKSRRCADEGERGAAGAC